jgi:aspartate racemase
MNNKLGIIGGVGPESTAFFLNMIISRTKVEKDQDHIDMVILNHASIPDRTKYLLDNDNESPLPYILEDIKLLNDLGVSLISIPCNTAFYFYDEFKKNSNVKILHLIEDTITYLKNKKAKNVYILATTGTIKTELYQNACLKHGLKFVLPSEESQKDLMHIIYNNIKNNSNIDINKFNKIIEEAQNNDVDYVIMGCTELSILKNRLNLDDFYIDPLEIETDIIINFFNKKTTQST